MSETVGRAASGVDEGNDVRGHTSDARRQGAVRFAIFDWLDESGRGIGETYEERLKLLEHADQAGFHGYHLAEHHGSALSTTPSPSIFLSAVAQRTRRLRLGALTYILPLYEPLRLLEEICMLDQLSRGRLELGVGRGSSPHEGERFGVRRDNSRAIFEESLAIVLMGLATGELNYQGEHFAYDHVVTRLHTRQRPYPPLWYPTSNAESVPWLAAQGFSTVFSLRLHPTFDQVRSMLERYRAEYERHRTDPNRLNGHVAEPSYGFSAHTYVADTDERALREVRPAHDAWFESFTRRYVERGQGEKYAGQGDLDRLLAEGKLFVGSPATVREQLGRALALSGANYFAGAFAFGDLTLEQSTRSLDLFAREVIPALSAGQRAAV